MTNPRVRGALELRLELELISVGRRHAVIRYAGNLHHIDVGAAIHVQAIAHVDPKPDVTVTDADIVHPPALAGPSIHELPR